MSDPIVIDDKNLEASIKPHESGHRMLVFSKFRPTNLLASHIDTLIKGAQSKVPSDIRIVRICLAADQKSELSSLQDLGFVADGYEYLIKLSALKTKLPADKIDLQPGFSIRKMIYDSDIDSVVSLERAVHAADKSSRVNFETDAAIAGMKGYYKRTSDTDGIYLLEKDQRIVGLVGFMIDTKHVGAMHISSIAIELELQGQGLFFPLILSSLRLSPFRDIDMLTGMTTTTRLIEAARKYGVTSMGVSLVKFQDLIREDNSTKDL
jgi:hypothetical protein